jgi:hypothetical protein
MKKKTQPQPEKECLLIFIESGSLFQTDNYLINLAILKEQNQFGKTTR